MVASLLTVALLFAEPLDAQRAAAIERDQQKAQAEVLQRFGNRKTSELSNVERGDMIRAQADADRRVLEQHGVDAKTWARWSMTLSRAQYAEQQLRVDALTKKETQDAEAATQSPAKKPEDIAVQRGFSDENPVILDEKEGAAPAIEKGLPLDARSDEQAAKDSDDADRKGAPETAPKKPTRPDVKGGEHKPKRHH